MEDDDGMHVSVPVRPLFDELCCPICFNTLSSSMITPCGHNFCEACIAECLNRKHSCPCCNAQTVVAQLARNHHLDRLIGVLEAQKEAASKAYFEKLIGGGAPAVPPSLTASGNAVPADGDATHRSPIEMLFTKHMRRSLGAYEEYYQELRGKYERACERVREEACEEMAKLTADLGKYVRKVEKKADGKEESVVAKKRRHDKKMLRVRQRCDEELEQMKASFDDSTRLLLDAYDSYMQEMAPAPAYLPVTVTLVVEQKGVSFDGVALSTTASLADVRARLRELLAQSGDEMTSEFTPSNVFVLRRRFAAGKVAQDGSHPDDVLIGDEHRPIVQYKVEPGSQLIMRGAVQLASDRPRMCFTADFEPGNSVDYFACKTCAINWVCKTCSECCHEGHEVVPYLQNHTPNWSCCYCVKHRKCKIKNSRNVGKVADNR